MSPIFKWIISPIFTNQISNTGTQYISEYMWNCAPTLLFYYRALLSQLIHWFNTAIWWLPRGQYLLWSDRMLYFGSSCHHICDTAGMNVFKHNIYTRENALHVFLVGSFAQRPKLTTKPTLPIKSASEVYTIQLSIELLQTDQKYWEYTPQHSLPNAVQRQSEILTLLKELSNQMKIFNLSSFQKIQVFNSFF